MSQVGDTGTIVSGARVFSQIGVKNGVCKASAQKIGELHSGKWADGARKRVRGVRLRGSSLRRRERFGVHLVAGPRDTRAPPTHCVLV